MTSLSFRFTDVTKNLVTALASAEGLDLEDRRVADARAVGAVCRFLDRARLLQFIDGPTREETPLGRYLGAVRRDSTTTVDLGHRCVLIVGCGGVGGELAAHLSAAGIGKMYLIDHDVVERSNFNRQYLFGSADVGRLKVVAASERLSMSNPTIQIKTFAARIDSLADLDALPLAHVDLVASCADQPSKWHSDQVTFRYARKHGLPFCTASVSTHNGSWGPIMFAEHEAKRGSWLDPLAVPLALPPTKASFGPTNSIVAGFLARDAVHALIGLRPASVARRFNIEFETMKISSESVVDE